MDTIDPRLQVLIEALAEGELTPDPDNPDFVIHVYVVVESDDFSAIEAAGFDVASPIGNSAVVTLELAAVENLAALPGIVGIFAPPVGTARDAPAVSTTWDQDAVKLGAAWAVTSRNRPAGTRGADVIVGIVDTSFDILHNAFTTEQVVGGVKVRRTRILRFWDQGFTSRGAGPVWTRNGRVYTEAEINTFLDNFVKYGTAPPPFGKDKSHGTETASVAAGSAWPKAPFGAAGDLIEGVAPEAKLILVRTLTDELAGIEFCFETAERPEIGLPCVVSVSLGDFGVPRNGLSQYCHRLRGLLMQGNPPVPRPGRAFVVSAGNAGDVHNHVNIDVSQPRVMEIDVEPNQTQMRCFVSSTQQGLKLSVAAPSNPRVFTDQGPYAGSKNLPAARPVARVAIATFPSLPASIPPGLVADSDTHTMVTVKPAGRRFITEGTWQLRLDPGGAPHPVVHVWLPESPQDDHQKISDSVVQLTWAKEDNHPFVPMGTPEEEFWFWRRDKTWIETTLDGGASTAVDAIVVGASARHGAAEQVPYRGSSRGPVTGPPRAAADSKPDVVAPGFPVFHARWKRAGNSLDRSSITDAGAGTSLAAPAVGGTVALMFSHDPTLTQSEIRAILRATAQPWSPATRQDYFVDRDINEQNIAGAGLTDIEKAVKAAAARVP